MSDKEWKIKTTSKNDYITVICEISYPKKKVRTVSEIRFPKEAAKDIIKAIKERQ